MNNIKKLREINKWNTIMGLWFLGQSKQITDASCDDYRESWWKNGLLLIFRENNFM